MVRKLTKLTLLLVAMFVMFSRSTAQGPPTADNRDNEPSSGTIKGIVVNDSGQPLAGATVVLRLSTPAGFMRSTTTDNDGSFQISNLQRALYTITANSPAHVIPPLPRDEHPPFYRIGDAVRLELVRGGIITGTVTNATNEPVIAVRVVAIRVRDEDGQPVKGISSGVGERASDDRGMYRIFGLLPGTYIVMAGGSSGFGSFQLNPYEMDVPVFAPSSTRDNAVEIAVRSGEETNVDIRYRGEPGRIVSGSVKGDAGPTFANITMTTVGNSAGAFGSAVQPPGARGFEFRGVADGVYELVAQQTLAAGGSPIPEMGFSEPRRITVKGADVTGIELIPKPMAAVSGRIILEPSNLEQCQGKRRPLFSETVVTLQRNRKNADSEAAANLRPFFSIASPDNEGTIAFRNLNAGQYSFTPRFFARYWYLQSITLTNTTPAAAKSATAKIDAARNWSTLKAGDRVTGLTITIAEGAASLRGSLDVPKPTKLPADLDLYLVPADKEKTEDVLRYFVADLRADETFSADNLPPGRYWLLAQRRSESERPTTSKLQSPDASETRVKLRRAAEALHSEIELKPCQNVADHRLRFAP
jgi:Carboxypeptidase regulatory-like domain